MTKSKLTIEKQFKRVNSAVKGVVAGHETMQLVCGPPGWGKTSLVMEALKQADAPVHVVSVNNESAFVNVLWQHHNFPVVFLDDSDQLASRPSCANIAKTAFGAQREVHWHSQQAYRTGDPPFRFGIRCGLIWCSNVNYTDEQIIKDQMDAHWEALLSRGLNPIWLDVSDDIEAFRYIIKHATTDGYLNKLYMPKTLAEKAIKIFIDKRDYWKELSPRLLVKEIATKCRVYANDNDELLFDALDRWLSPEPLRKLPTIPFPTIVGKGVWKPNELAVA